jgi:hypothetical protein
MQFCKMESAMLVEDWVQRKASGAECQNHTKHISIYCLQNVEPVIVKIIDMYSYYCALNG